MNRPRLLNLLSAALGSTTAFLVLSRWSLAGTITGAVLMPVIFTLVSFSSQETLERASKWLTRHARRRLSKASAKPSENEEAKAHETGRAHKESSGATVAKPRARSLQWSVAILASLAFAVSIYSLTQDGTTGVTILREKVIETVTVTSEQPTLSVARSIVPATAETTLPSAGDVATTTTALNDQGEPSPSTDSTLAGPSTTTTLP